MGSKRLSKPITGPEDPRHGTYAGYQAEYAAGGRAGTCERCRAAEAAYQRTRKRRNAYGRPLLADGTGSVRRIQALQAIGYPAWMIARELGCSRPNLPSGKYPKVRIDRVKAIAELYERWVCHDGPSPRTRGWAAKLGFAAPDQWLGRDIDDPAAQPATIEVGDAELDEVAVERAFKAMQYGQERLPLTRREKVALIALADQRGVSRSQVQRYLKASVSTWSTLINDRETA